MQKHVSSFFICAYSQLLMSLCVRLLEGSIPAACMAQRVWGSISTVLGAGLLCGALIWTPARWRLCVRACARLARSGMGGAQGDSCNKPDQCCFCVRCMLDVPTLRSEDVEGCKSLPELVSTKGVILQTQGNEEFQYVPGYRTDPSSQHSACALRFTGTSLLLPGLGNE